MRAATTNFVEVYVECPIDVLVERDVKGLYKKAIAGEIKNFTGISDPYEAPLQAEVVVNSATQSIEESAALILKKLEDLGYALPAADNVYTDEEEDLVEDRLRALGYM